MANDLIPASLTAVVNPELAPEAERTASELASVYEEATTAIAGHIRGILEQCARLNAAFHAEGWGGGFTPSFSYDGDHYIPLDDEERLFAKMERRAWRVLIDKLGVKQIMSVKTREAFEKRLEKCELPPICRETIKAALLSLAGQAQTFAVEACKEVFDILRPRGPVSGEYATNKAGKWAVGRKVILTWYVERTWDGTHFRTNYHRDKELTAIDAVFHLLDGRGIMRDNKGPLIRAIEATEDGRGETDYFKFRCFKNRNLHLEFKRLDLVQELNFQACGERVLGEVPKE
jgi:hypothetical protein